jgi:hypothetical protein
MIRRVLLYIDDVMNKIDNNNVEILEEKHVEIDSITIHLDEKWMHQYVNYDIE